MEYNSTSELVIEAKVGGVTGMIVVDTGAQVSLIDRRIVHSTVSPTEIQVKGITGDSMKIYGVVEQVLQLDSTEFSCNFVVTDLPEDYVAILGYDVLRWKKAVIDLENFVLEMEGRKVTSLCEMENSTPLKRSGLGTAHKGLETMGPGDNSSNRQPLSQGSLTAYCPNDLKIPARSEKLCKIRIRKNLKFSKETLENREVVTEPKVVTVHGLFVARTLTKVDNGTCWTKVINVSSEDLLIPKNTALCSLEEIQESAQANNFKRINLAQCKQEEFEKSLEVKLEHLPEEERNQLRSLLIKYSDLFSLGGIENLGCTGIVKHKINTGNHSPINKRPYRVPQSQRGVLKELIQDQLDKKVIKPSTSPWSAPVVIVPKKPGPDGVITYRMCVDFRELNKITVPEVYPLPDIHETLDMLGGSKYFTALDMNSGFFQVQMDPDSQEKTGFSTPDGHYEYTRMPMGLINSPACFQRLVDTTLSGLKDACLPYMDDILIFSTDIDQHCKDISRVLNRFKEVNLSVQLKKCQIAQSQINFLGHTISREGIKPCPKKIEIVKNYPQPKNEKEIRSFIGLCSYYRRHVPNFAEIAKPLTKLTKKNETFNWTAETETSFQKLKTILTTEPLLIYPDFSKKFILSTDASGIAIGAVLGQVINGTEHPIAYASRQLNSAERNYSVTERELLAVIWSVKYFRCYLYGRSFDLFTDHSAIKWLLSLKDPSSRLTRWSLKLAEYDYQVHHKPGVKNQNADCLSRIVCKNTCESLPILDIDSIKEQQKEDTECQRLKRHEHFKTSPQGVIYIKKEDRQLILIPKKLREKVIRLHHDLPTAGHAGVKKTMLRIMEKFYWPKMKIDVNRFIRACDACSKRSDYGKTKAPLGKFEESTEFGFRIATDIVGPLPLTKSNSKYILTVIDHFTRYAEFIALPDQTAETTAQALVQRIFTKFGVPEELISDQGTNFTSELMKQVCKLLRIRKLQTTAYHPMSNGRTERVHRTIPRMLSHYVNKNQSDWDELLPMINMAYNSQVHETTGFTPYELVYGKKMRTPLESDLRITEDTEIFSDYVEDLRQRLSEFKDLALANQGKAQSAQKRQYDKTAKETEYKKGDKVYLYTPQIKKGRVKKLSRLWKGPYKVVDVVSKLNVILRIRGKDVKVHVNRIKPAIELEIEENKEENVSENEPNQEEREEEATEINVNDDTHRDISTSDQPEVSSAEERPGPSGTQVVREREDIMERSSSRLSTSEEEDEERRIEERNPTGRFPRIRNKPFKFKDYV